MCNGTCVLCGSSDVCMKGHTESNFNDLYEAVQVIEDLEIDYDYKVIPNFEPLSINHYKKSINNKSLN